MKKPRCLNKSNFDIKLCETLFYFEMSFGIEMGKILTRILNAYNLQKSMRKISIISTENPCLPEPILFLWIWFGEFGWQFQKLNPINIEGNEFFQSLQAFFGLRSKDQWFLFFNIFEKTSNYILEKVCSI